MFQYQGRVRPALDGVVIPSIDGWKAVYPDEARRRPYRIINGFSFDPYPIPNPPAGSTNQQVFFANMPVGNESTLGTNGPVNMSVAVG